MRHNLLPKYALKGSHIQIFKNPWSPQCQTKAEVLSPSRPPHFLFLSTFKNIEFQYIWSTFTVSIVTSWFFTQRNNINLYIPMKKRRFFYRKVWTQYPRVCQRQEEWRWWSTAGNAIQFILIFTALLRFMNRCRIPIRHFFSQSRRLLTKIFKSAETANEKFRCLWIRGQGAIKLGYYARYLFPLSPFHKTRDTPSRVKQGGSKKSFGISSWHLLRRVKKLQRKKEREKDSRVNE